MIRPATLIKYVLEPKKHLWMDVFWVRETPKAILIKFDSQKVWIPKAWIVQIKKNGDSSIKIKISDYHWTRKFA